MAHDRPADTDSESRLLRCADCGSFYPAQLTNDGELVPVGGAPENQCSVCGDSEFVQVTFDSLEGE
jgi:hypothetical protein